MEVHANGKVMKLSKNKNGYLAKKNLKKIEKMPTLATYKKYYLQSQATGLKPKVEEQTNIPLR